MELIIGCIVLLLIYYLYILRSKKLRIKYLTNKYKDPDIVERILSKSFWQGQTPEQLIDSLGKPLDTDRKVLKTKTKEVWKYSQQGRNRYALKIILEDDVVIGWDIK